MRHDILFHSSKTHYNTILSNFRARIEVKEKAIPVTGREGP
jgi:hypothetical protein